MADIFRREDLQQLVEHRQGPVVSILMPTHRVVVGADRQDPIRLKNLLDRAEEQLLARGQRGPQVRGLLDPGRRLLDAGMFWSHQGDGLAIHLAPGWSRVHRLPLAVPEAVVVGDRCYVKPLLDLLSSDRRYFVLAMSQGDVRLFEGSRQEIRQVGLGETPRSLDEVLEYDVLEKELNLHVASRGGAGARPVFHGHGSGDEVDSVLRDRWARALAEGVQGVLRGETAPLVLAGVGYEQALFRRASSYPRVLAEGIDGNPEPLTPAQLHERAWAIVEPVVTSAREEAAARVSAAAGREDGGAVLDVAGCVSAALEGRVDHLFVAAGQHVWGTVDELGQAVEVATGDAGPHAEDLLDRAAQATLLTSGTVHVVDADQVPGPGPASALLRY